MGSQRTACAFLPGTLGNGAPLSLRPRIIAEPIHPVDIGQDLRHRGVQLEGNIALHLAILEEHGKIVVPTLRFLDANVSTKELVIDYNEEGPSFTFSLREKNEQQ